MTSESTEKEFGELFASRFAAGHLSHIVGNKTGPLVSEIDFVQGRPDFLCATYPARRGSHQRAGRIGKVISSNSAANILGQLKPNAVRSATYLREKTGLSPGRFDSIISELRTEGLVSIWQSSESNTLLTSNLPSVELTVFELKLEKWRRAIFQALQYRVAAHRVAIIMPADRIHRIAPHAGKLREFGVGVISLDWSDGEASVVIYPRKSRPLSMRHHYVALGNYLKSISQTEHVTAIA